MLFDIAKIRKGVLEPLVCAWPGLERGAGATAAPYPATPLSIMPRLESLLMREIVARAYIGMASGSPCVVPSRESIQSPSIKRSVGTLHVLIRTVASAGQILLIL